MKAQQNFYKQQTEAIKKSVISNIQRMKDGSLHGYGSMFYEPSKQALFPFIWEIRKSLPAGWSVSLRKGSKGSRVRAYFFNISQPIKS